MLYLQTTAMVSSGWQAGGHLFGVSPDCRWPSDGASRQRHALCVMFRDHWTGGPKTLTRSLVGKRPKPATYVRIPVFSPVVMLTARIK